MLTRAIWWCYTNAPWIRFVGLRPVRPDHQLALLGLIQTSPPINLVNRILDQTGPHWLGPSGFRPNQPNQRPDPPGSGHFGPFSTQPIKSKLIHPAYNLVHRFQLVNPGCTQFIESKPFLVHSTRPTDFSLTRPNQQQRPTGLRSTQAFRAQLEAHNNPFPQCWRHQLPLATSTGHRLWPLPPSSIGHHRRHSPLATPSSTTVLVSHYQQLPPTTSLGASSDGCFGSLMPPSTGQSRQSSIWPHAQIILYVTLNLFPSELTYIFALLPHTSQGQHLLNQWFWRPSSLDPVSINSL